MMCAEGGGGERRRCINEKLHDYQAFALILLQGSSPVGRACWIGCHTFNSDAARIGAMGKRSRSDAFGEPSGAERKLTVGVDWQDILVLCLRVGFAKKKHVRPPPMLDMLPRST